MYLTRNNLAFSAPRPIFWTLSMLGCVNILGALALSIFIAGSLVIGSGDGESVVGNIHGWAWVVFACCLAISWSSVACLVAFNSNDIEFNGNPVVSAYKSIAISRWGRSTGLSMGIPMVVLVIVESRISGMASPILIVLILSVLCGLFWKATIRSILETRRVMRASSTSPLFVQAGGYVENAATREFRFDIGPDWALPDVVHDARVAKKFEKAASARARTLFLMGRAMAWISAPIAIASVSWLVSENRPGPMVGLPMLVIAALILGWILERHSKRFDTLADDYRSASVADRSSLLRRKFDTMEWVPES